MASVARPSCPVSVARRRQRDRDDSAAAAAGTADETAVLTLTPEQRRLVVSHIHLVAMHLRNRVFSLRRGVSGRDYDDLYQEGCLALIRAAARYDPDCDGLFAAYALLRIRGAVRALLDQGPFIVRMPIRASRASGRWARGWEPLELHRAVLATEMPADDRARAGDEMIRHAVRRRFERAVRQALAELRRRRWSRRNPCDVMTRIADERLLIADPNRRQSHGRIAQATGVPRSRVNSYEKQLLDVVARYFARDPQVSLLVVFAREDTEGFDGFVTRQRRQLLDEADLRAFSEHFHALDPAGRAQVMYALIERSAPAVAEVARNLYRLTVSDETEPVPLTG